VFTVSEAAVEYQDNLGYEGDVRVKPKSLAVSVSRTELLNSEENA
jgi:hypothetical protein